MLKQTVTSVSEHIFPGIGHSFSDKAQIPKGKSSKLWLYLSVVICNVICKND